jgi:hypothetical protein
VAVGERAEAGDDCTVENTTARWRRRESRMSFTPELGAKICGAELRSMSASRQLVATARQVARRPRKMGPGV